MEKSNERIQRQQRDSQLRDKSLRNDSEVLGDNRSQIDRNKVRNEQ